MSDVKTKSAVVVSDGLTYKVPGQGQPVVAFGFAQTYLTRPATRGDVIELDADEYDRFMGLGSIAEEGSREATAAQNNQLRWGDPYGAVKISSEDGNLPIDKMKAEAKRLGFYKDPFGEDDDPDEGVSGAAPADIDLTDERALDNLKVAQLKQLAQREGVEVSGNKADLVAAIHKHGTSKSS